MLPYYLLIVVSIYLLIQLMPIYLEVYVNNEGDERNIMFMVIIITFFSLLKIKLDLQRLMKLFNFLKKIREKIKSVVNVFKKKENKKRKSFPYKLIGFFKNVLLDFIKSLVLHKLYIKLFLGLKEASITAVTFGAIYSIMGLIKPITSDISTSKNCSKDIYIKPFYNQIKFDLNFNCKIKFRLINITLIILKHLATMARRRIKKWIIIPSRA